MQKNLKQVFGSYDSRFEAKQVSTRFNVRQNLVSARRCPKHKFLHTELFLNLS